MKNSSLGVDIEEVKRIGQLIRNKRFLARVFSSQEIAYCKSKKNKAQHFAVRFAAKEAVWKALSDELTRKKLTLSHKDISIKNRSNGKPEVVLPKRLARLKNKTIISLSHTSSYAVAVAMVQA